MEKFENFETGGYKANPNRAVILNVLEQIKYQSITQICKNTNLSVDEVTSVLEGDEEIDCRAVGVITVYYLKANKPEGTLYNTGKGFRVSLSENGKNSNGGGASATRGHSAPTQDKLDLKIIERFASEGKSHKQLAAALGVTLNSVSFYLSSKKYPRYGDAWRRGKLAAMKANAPESEIIFPLTLRDTEIDALVSSISA
jgi:hypothetical protein